MQLRGVQLQASNNLSDTRIFLPYVSRILPVVDQNSQSWFCGTATSQVAHRISEAWPLIVFPLQTCIPDALRSLALPSLFRWRAKTLFVWCAACGFTLCVHPLRAHVAQANEKRDGESGEWLDASCQSTEWRWSAYPTPVASPWRVCGLTILSSHSSVLALCIAVL